jgi:hypothetical protein
MVSVSQLLDLYYTVTTSFLVLLFQAQMLLEFTSTLFGKQLQLTSGYTMEELTN